MASNYSFAVMPSVSISRSRFERKSQHKTSFNLGDIVPIYVDEVLPGDTRSIDLAALVRMSTPIAPIMDNIYLDYFAFFVPNRLVMDKWKVFMGENELSAGIPTEKVSIPSIRFSSPGEDETVEDIIPVDSLAAYFGIPVGAGYGDNNPIQISALPFRMYYLIYNEWFRNQNIIAPVAISKAATNGVLVSNSLWGTSYDCDTKLPLMKAAKLPDYFTKALPYAQKGDAVQIPLGLTAPIIGALDEGSPDFHSSSGLYFATDNDGPEAISGLLGTDDDGLLGIDSQTFTSDGDVAYNNLVADLSKVAGTINELRYAFQLQKFLEADSRFGTRYWEILAGHFNVRAPDASLQRPEYLGGHRMNINIDQVLSTAGYSNTSSTTVGAPGANSVTGKKVSLFTKSFTEHGFIFILAVARHDQTYSAGVNKMWMRKSRYDFYWPEFANLGAQAVYYNELKYDGATPNNGIFGYQEAWAEYRYKPSLATGLMNPERSGSLDYWTLTNDFGAYIPQLNKSFIEQGRDALSRALVTGLTGPDFIGDFFFRDVAVRPMPTYSIPGLADHH